ncbi:MAG: hypothetical protein HZA54_03725 [Planctomycetes bacterium]|nr:hypothetical protein [Planctomycetota bacterium]
MVRGSGRAGLGVLALMGVGLSWAWAQNPPGGGAGKPKVDEKAVDAAVEKGAAWLKRKARFSETAASSELVLFTLIHAGVFLNDPVVEQGIDFVTNLKLDQIKFHQRTYRVALAAMALEAANRTRWQDRIVEYAYFLAANQCKNGQWSYGEIPPLPAFSGGPGGGGKQAPSGGGVPGAGGRRGEKTEVQKQIPINIPKRIGPDKGDNSNTQFALLGLRACADAGCKLPESTWADARRVMEGAQKSDGGWGYTADSGAGKGPGGNAAGSYGSMSCSGLCDLVITLWNLGDRGFKGNGRVQKAAQWIDKNFTITENPGAEPGALPGNAPGGGTWHYYYLYSLERAGMLLGVDQFGAHDWYAEGATWLLERQQADGSWDGGGNEVSDTCFAILFLRRATKPIVPSIHSK